VYLTLWGNVIGIIRQRANRSRRWCIGGRREELAFRWPRRLTLAAWHSWHAAAFPCLWRSGSIAASIAVLQSSARPRYGLHDCTDHSSRPVTMRSLTTTRASDTVVTRTKNMRCRVHCASSCNRAPHWPLRVSVYPIACPAWLLHP
jgi:hypothetical protein